MDGSVHREIGRHKANHHKADNSQWMVPQQLKFMSITAERDNAIHERNIALAEKRTALAERDMAILQKDTAIAERNRAIVERDSAIASLEYVRENVLNFTNGSIRSQRCPSPQVNVKHQNQQEHVPHVDSPPRLADAPYDHDRMLHIADAYPISAKPQHSKRSRTGMKAHGVPVKKVTKSRKCKESKKGNATLHGESRGQESIDTGGNLNKDVSLPNKVWNTEVSGLNQVTFDETTMPLPGCSCTGTLHQCYKWGNGGWQSSCCTTTMSMYPLPMVPSKGRGRIGGRKMSGSAFNKLLSRLVQQGYDLSMPLDLKNHWAKHGTNRYITIK